MTPKNVPIALSRRAVLAAADAGDSTNNSAVSASTAAKGGESTFGQGADDESLRDAWRKFCRQLESAGDKVFKNYNPPTPLQRADGFRFLTQNLGQAFALGYETKDPRFPVVHSFCTPFRKLGSDNADCVYQQAWIDGQSVYKLSGNRGTGRFLNFTIMGPRPDQQPGSRWRPLHDPFGDKPEANLFGHQLESQWDGSFELYIGGPKRGPNWLPTTPGTRKLYLRQYFDDWREEPARFRIERIGMTEPRPVPTPADMKSAMEWAGRFVADMMNDWPDWQYAFASGSNPEIINNFPTKSRVTEDPVYTAATDKLRGRAGANMRWRLAPDETLIIEFDQPDFFWMMTNMGMFGNSMDFLYRPVSYTPSRTKVDSDGKIRMILAHDDPGFHNWIDTQGFGEGNLVNRNVLTQKFTIFYTQVVKRSKLSAALPVDTVKVTREQRVMQMLERFHGIQKRYGV